MSAHRAALHAALKRVWLDRADRRVEASPDEHIDALVDAVEEALSKPPVPPPNPLLGVVMCGQPGHAHDFRDCSTPAATHECVFVEEQEPSGRLVLPPCLVCGVSALDALEQLRGAA